MTKRQKREEEDVKIADEEATKKGRERNSVPTPSAAVAPTTERNVFFTFGRNFSVKIPEGSFGGDLQNKIAGALGKNVVDIEIRLPKELMKYSTTPDATDTDTFMLDTMEKLDPEFFNTLDGLSKPDRALKGLFLLSSQFPAFPFLTFFLSQSSLLQRLSLPRPKSQHFVPSLLILVILLALSAGRRKIAR